jgi:isoleucyl-tRNA synthetase
MWGAKLNLKNFNAFCKEYGIVKWTTTPYTLKQNGVIEKKNWTLIENVQCMLQHMKLDHKL